MKRFNDYIVRNHLERKEYQMEGVKWCVGIEGEGRRMDNIVVRGGILADEMGLGKTSQMIGLILCRFVRRTLIVVPRALLEQWESVIYNTLGHECVVYHGKKPDMEKVSRAPIVLTTYGTLSQLKEKARKGAPLVFGELMSIEWDRVIFDEAHHMRNRNTRVHKAGCVVRAKHKWLVTGTPIQNGISDFYGLCSVLGLSREFYTKRENVGDIARELILKRTKAEVGLILPDLTKHVVNVEWGSVEEKTLASDIHAHLEFSKVAIRDENSFKSLGIHHFAMLQRARQACINMDLLANSVKALKELGILDDSEFIESALKYQSKLDKVKETILGRMDNGRGKLVFCHYLGEMDSLVSAMRSSGMNVGRFDGKTSQSARSEMLTDSSLDAIVLQIKTGCEGLNLQRFSEVYFVSPDWNPAIEDQAVARCHRIGQENGTDVFSFRMESFDGDAFTRTMDMYTRDLQQSKRLQMRAIEGETEGCNGEEMEEVCAICLEAQHKNTCHHLECKHYFHRDCLGKWFKRDRTCPLCRAD
jgi:SNF2 family DNA or RNA helicase